MTNEEAIALVLRLETGDTSDEDAAVADAFNVLSEAPYLHPIDHDYYLDWFYRLHAIAGARVVGFYTGETVEEVNRKRDWKFAPLIAKPQETNTERIRRQNAEKKRKK